MTVLNLITDGSLEESEKMDIIDKVHAAERHFEYISCPIGLFPVYTSVKF